MLKEIPIGIVRTLIQCTDSRRRLSGYVLITSPQRGVEKALSGGRIELTDIDIVAAAIREIEEETGLTIDRTEIFLKYQFVDRRYEVKKYLCIATIPQDRVSRRSRSYKTRPTYEGEEIVEANLSKMQRWIQSGELHPAQKEFLLPVINQIMSGMLIAQPRR